MAHWLVKSEPEDYGWDDLVRERNAVWDGVRNAEARNNLARMRVGDGCLFYHSGGPREIVGVAKVVRASFPDPTDERWLAVGLAPGRALKRAVSLAELKADARFADLALVRRARLSVMPVSTEHRQLIEELSKA